MTNMNLVDVHCHLDHERFRGDVEQVVERARQAGVKAIITSGVNLATNRIVLGLAGKFDIVHASLGLYPIDALASELNRGEADGFARDIEKTNVDEVLGFIEKNRDNCVAIGECGLDYHWVKDKQKEMKDVFQKVISLAEKIKKPLVIHSRKAELDCIEMLESSKVKKVMMHCFQGSRKLIERAAGNGWSFSIPANINRLQHFQMLAGMVNLSQIFTETDAPYLSPVPGQRNEPAFVAGTVKKIAEIKGMDQNEVADNIYMNFQRLFL